MRQASAAAGLWASVLCSTAAAGGSLPQLNHFLTGFDGNDVPLTVPAIDPAGITWHAPSGHLFIADSEINEVAEAFSVVGANVFEVSPQGDVLFAAYDLTALGNNEPTGITYNEFDGFFYVSNDDNQTVTRYAFSAGAGFAVDDVVATDDTAGLGDPEGITADPDTGLIYVVDGGAEAVAVYEYAGGFVLVDFLDLNALNDPADVPSDPEGIAFDPCTGTLLLVSDPQELIYEFTADGFFLAAYDISALSPDVVAPQGLAVGPTSDTGDDPLATAIFIADGGVDNNQDPSERDGAVYELDAGCPGTANAPPVIDPIADQVTDEGTELSLVATASDPDAGDVLTFSLTGTVPSGAAIDPDTGVFTWTPSEEQGPGLHDVTVRVTDDGEPSLFDETTFSVTVNEVNQPPVLDPIADQSVEEGTELSLIATASDPDPGNALAFSLDGTVPAGASIDPDTGVFTWTPAADQGPAIYDITVRVTDDGVPALFDETTFAVTVTEGNGPPVLDPISDQTTDELTELALLITAVDPDPEDTLTFSLEGTVPAGAMIDPVSGLFTWTPAEEQGPGTYDITVRVTDDGSPPLFDEATFTVTVNEDNDAPIVDPVPDQMVEELTELSLLVTAFDPNPDDVLTFSLEGTVPAGAMIDPVSGLFTWTPAEEQGPGTYDITVRATDDGVPSLFDETTFMVSVNEDNHAPVLDPVPDQAVDEGTELSLLITALDPDPEDTLTFSLEDPVPAGAAIDPASGLFTWAPTEKQGPGTYDVTVRVTDDGVPLLFDETSFMVEVNEINDPPVLDPIGDRTVEVNELLAFTATATDPDGDPPPPGGLVAYWPFDADFASTTGAHDGTPVNGAILTTDSFLGAGALLLDGADDFVSFGDIALPGDLTVAAWVRPLNIANGGGSDAVLFGDADNDDWIRFEASNVRTRFNGDANNLDTDPPFVNGSWQHLVLLRSGETILVFRNGALVGSGSENDAFTPELLGMRPGDHYEGLIDDVAVWDRALETSEIAFLYNGGAGNPAGEVDEAPGGLVYSLHGDVPPGATIDAASGEFTWVAPPTPTSYTFIVRVTDDGEPPLADEEEITVSAIVPCPADLDGDGLVGVTDFLALLSAWDSSPGGPPDLDGDGTVGTSDMLELLAAWGPCM